MQISDLVRTTRFWNNLLQVLSHIRMYIKYKHLRKIPLSGKHIMISLKTHHNNCLLLAPQLASVCSLIPTSTIKVTRHMTHPQDRGFT